MQEKFIKSYVFALKNALYIALILTLITGVFLYFIQQLQPIIIGLYFSCVFGISFLVIQFSIEQFIYKHIQKIYNDLTQINSVNTPPQSVTTNMKTLTEEIDKFTRDKRIEIETLQDRELYRKEFLGNVSHELKTPLFTVQGYILTLLDGAKDNEVLLNKYLERAAKGIERLGYIVKDLDMITQLEVGQLQLNIEAFDIVELIQSVFDMLEMKAQKKKISLIFNKNYKTPILVNADKERIRQLLINLIVNSIKYGDDKGTTEVSIDDLIKNKLLIRITDNGEGIESKHIPRLFERFYRVDKSGSRKEGGSGLGLAIVKHIIEAHNEKIYIESQIDIGSEFSFTLEKAN